MQLRDRKVVVANTAEEWCRQYFTRYDNFWYDDEKRRIYMELVALPPNPSRAAIDAIIGSSIRTENTCSECGNDVEIAVEISLGLGELCLLCPDCVKQAVLLLRPNNWAG